MVTWCVVESPFIESPMENIDRSPVPATVESRPLVAWEVTDPGGITIEPAPTDRAWMDATDLRFAYRCLPLVIANQAGWIVRSPVRVSARWNGGPRPSDVRLWFPAGRKDPRIVSHFGEGVLTFSVPYLIRTPPGINLWVKGPSNWLKDGIQPLEGIVETDWTESTFTMNWRFTRPHVTVRFEEREPFCMLVPIPRGLVESFVPQQRPLEQNAELFARYERWKQARGQFNTDLKDFDSAAAQQGWQRDYMLGRDHDGRTFAEHQTRLHVRPFTRGATEASR